MINRILKDVPNKQEGTPKTAGTFTGEPDPIESPSAETSSLLVEVSLMGGFLTKVPLTSEEVN